MARQKAYTCIVGGRGELLVAAPSRKVAAALMGLSLHELTTYGLGASEEEEALALNSPGTVFWRPDAFAGQWELRKPAESLP